MELKKVTLENVRNFTHQEFTFQPGVNEVKAPNAWGKSTLADAYFMLLTNKLYLGSSDLTTLKPIEDTSRIVKVEAIIQLSNGTELTLTKEYKEKWVTARGSTEAVMSGHETICYINGVKKLQKDYDSELCGYFGVSEIEMNQVLSSAYYFSEGMDWKKRLGIVNMIIGSVTPEDVYKLAPLTRDLDTEFKVVGYKIPDLRKKYKDRLDTYSDNVKTLEAQIRGDVIENPVTKEELDTATKIVENLSREILDLSIKRNGHTNPVLEALKQRKQTAHAGLVKSQQSDVKYMQDANEKVNEQINDIRKSQSENERKMNSLTTDKSESKRTIDSLNEKIRTNKGLIIQKQAQISAKRSEFDSIKKRVYEPIESTLCPNCSYDLSKETNEQRLTEFNQKKANDIRDNNKSGLELSTQISKLTIDVSGYENEITANQEKLAGLESLFNEYSEKNSNLEMDALKLKSNKVYDYKSKATITIEEEIDNVQIQINKEENETLDTSMIDEEIDRLKSEQQSAQSVVNQFNAQKEIGKRKLEREKQISVERGKVANQEVQIDLLKSYTETLLNTINERIHQKFGDIKLRLIKDNIKEGSWNETCEVLIDTKMGEVTYTMANTESQIRTGVKLADRISLHLGTEPLPIFIDDCEHITKSNRFFDTRSQVICLIAEE